MDGMLKISTGELKTIFTKTLESKMAKGILNFDKYNLISRALTQDDIDNQDYKDVRATLHSYQEQAYNEALTKEIEQLLRSLNDIPDNFFGVMYKSGKYDTFPFFAYCDDEGLAKRLVNATPGTILKFAEFLGHRYRAVNIGEYLIEDALPLKSLLLSIDSNLADNVLSGATRYAMKALVQALTNATQRLSATGKIV